MKAWIGLAVLGLAVPAEATPLGDALARHAAADVTALRGQATAGARCTLGAIYAKRNDLTRAGLYLDGCEDSELPEDIAVEIGKLARDTKRALEASQLARIQILALPDGAHVAATIDALPDEPLTTPVILWLKPGHYEVHATIGTRRLTNVIDAQVHSQSTTILDPGTQPAVTVPKDASVDFNEEGATEAETGPPPEVKLKPLLPCRYSGTCTDAGEQLADPLADRAAHLGSHPAWRIGARFGAGMFDHGGGDARAGFAAAATGRLALTPTIFAAARLDWSRRGGTVTTGTVMPGSSLMSANGIDALGASAGLGATLLDRAALDLALTASLRTDLRFQSTLDTLPVSRLGLGASLALDAAIHNTPLAVGLRFEQGLTQLVPGSRDRALLVELGVDWR